MNDKNKNIIISSDRSFSELSTIRELKCAFNKSQISNISHAKSFRDCISRLVMNFSIPELEKLVSASINDEFVKIGIFDDIISAGTLVNSKIEKIKFFSTPGSYITGLFSSEFSSSDLDNWSEIQNIFDSIYDQNSGKLKEIQDHFLFKMSSENLKSVISKNSISLQEELFLRSIFVKCYLSSLRDFIMPFYQIDNKFLINFKKSRINELENQVERDSHYDSELILLRQQICELETKELLASSISSQQDSKLETISEKITAGNLKFNRGSVILGSVETARYLTSTIGHKAGIDTLKSFGNFGLKATSAFSKLIPFVSTGVEGYTQIKNNEVVYDYEKRLKLISIVEKVKKNLLVLEQQVTNHYIDNILTRLQSTIIENNQQIYNLAVLQYQEHLTKNLDFERQIQDVSNQYKENIAIIEKTEILTRQYKIDQLDIELFSLQNQIESTKRELLKVSLEKTQEEKKLNLALESVREDLKLTKDFLSSQQDVLRAREKNATRAILNGSSDFQSALVFEVEKRKETEATIYILLENERKSQLQIKNLQSKVDLLQSQILESKDCAEAIEQLLNDKLRKVSFDRNSLLEKLNKQQKELSESKILNEKLKDFEKINNQYWKLKETNSNLEFENSKFKIEVKNSKESLQARCVVNQQQHEELGYLKLALQKQKKEKETVWQEIKILKEHKFYVLVEKVQNSNSWVFSTIIIIVLLITLKFLGILANLINWLTRKKTTKSEK